MEIQDTQARQLLIRLLAKRREYIMEKLALIFPEKKERLHRLKPIAFQHTGLEPLVEESREVEF
jgi:hypothetical protein